jgi:hypothetical protein
MEPDHDTTTSPPLTESQWDRLLGEALDRPVRTRYGRARTRPVEARWGEVVELRLHRFFAEAPEDVRMALAAWLRGPRRRTRSGARLDAWIDERLAELPAARPRREALRTEGSSHDLEGLLARVLADSFGEGGIARTPEPVPAITWGRAGRRPRRSLQLGCYVPARSLVRIHPVLDRPEVPGWFVASVVGHELLHAALPSERDSAGRTLHHGPAFRRAEESLPDHERARAWQERWTPALLRAARNGTPLPRGAGDATPRRAVQPGLFAGIARVVLGHLR